MSISNYTSCTRSCIPQEDKNLCRIFIAYTPISFISAMEIGRLNGMSSRTLTSTFPTIRTSHYAWTHTLSFKTLSQPTQAFYITNKNAIITYFLHLVLPLSRDQKPLTILALMLRLKADRYRQRTQQVLSIED